SLVERCSNPMARARARFRISLVNHVVKQANRYQFGATEQNALAIAFDSRGQRGSHVVLAARLRIAKVMEVGILQFQEVVADAHQRAQADEGAGHVDDDLMVYHLFQHAIPCRSPAESVSKKLATLAVSPRSRRRTSHA